MTTIYTVGYAQWTAAQLQTRLEAMDAHLVDIRLSDYSQRAEFNGDQLRRQMGERYHWIGAWGNVNHRRGGPIKIASFREGLMLFRRLVGWHKPAVLMCACANHDTCHRAVVADMLRQAGYQVEELMSGDPAINIRAISLWDPWASLVAWGEKTYETRSWTTTYRGLLAIHATKAFPNEARSICNTEPFHSVLIAHGVTKFSDLPRGAIVAVVDLVDVENITWKWTSPEFASPLYDCPPHERDFGDYSPGRFAWRLANVRVPSQPIPCRGAMGLWTPPDIVVARGRGQAR